MLTGDGRWGFANADLLRYLALKDIAVQPTAPEAAAQRIERLHDHSLGSGGRNCSLSALACWQQLTSRNERTIADLEQLALILGWPTPTFEKGRGRLRSARRCLVRSAELPADADW